VLLPREHYIRAPKPVTEGFFRAGFQLIARYDDSNRTSTMGSAAQTKSPIRTACLSLLGCALCAGVFAYSLGSGSVPVPARYRAADVSLAHHPRLFWAIEAFWLLLGIGAGLNSMREFSRARRGVPEPAAEPRQKGLPESLNELVRTSRVPKESVPRLLAELRPSLKPSDYYPVLHRRTFEWTGAILALILFSGMFLALVLLPQVSNVLTILAFSLAIAVVLSIFFGIPKSLRSRREAQMQRIFASEAFYNQSQKIAVPVPPVVRKREPIDSEGRELRCTSPDGRYVIYVRPREMKMSQWTFTPEMIDSTTGRVVFHPREAAWTLEKVVWQTASLVAMRLRKYPGDHSPVGATFDCASGAAHIDGIAVPFTNQAMMEKVLEEAYEASKAAYHPVQS
jgi:hypothetical protein